MRERQSVVAAADDRMNACDDIEGSERQRLSSTKQVSRTTITASLEREKTKVAILTILIDPIAFSTSVPSPLTTVSAVTTLHYD